jgi:hypothetical protein
MNVCFVDTPEASRVPSLSANSMCVGRVVGVTAAGEALVEYPGNLEGPRRARSVVALDATEETGAEPLPVLLFLNGQDSHTPIILGVIRDTVRQPRPVEGASFPRPGREVLVDGKAIQVEADQEIVLRCGASSLVMRRDGKIILKGTEIVSRASEANKIKGAVVKIN